jgi:toluene monooxygenase system ferredoxin subunit
MCPHANEPLADARFDGSVLACRHHDWEFDATSGNCVRGQPCQLKHFPVEVRDGKVWVDTPAPAPKPA